MKIIEKFAKDTMGIELTQMQVAIIESWLLPRNKEYQIPRLRGESTAMKVLNAYLQTGLQEAE